MSTIVTPSQYALSEAQTQKQYFNPSIIADIMSKNGGKRGPSAQIITTCTKVEMVIHCDPKFPTSQAQFMCEYFKAPLTRLEVQYPRL